ncbi:MAG: UPF0489 family protein [Bacteriovoracaceae bacterium]|nr:UPF0489 family protein [Bacteriovoracaceae bacterium]
MNHIIPFKSRGFSGPHTDHLLFQDNKIYVMDNHRLALWAWSDALKLTQSSEQFNLLHIDAHPDMSDAALNDIQKLAIDWSTISINDYQHLWQTEYNIPLIRWDNYLTIFLDQFSKRVNFENTFSATHKMGSSKKLRHDILPHELLKFMNDYIGERLFYNPHRWIVNLDLDYFFSPQPEKVILFSDDVIDQIAKCIKTGIENDIIAVCTIALSPECSGSWEKAEWLLEKMFGYKFDIKD